MATKTGTLTFYTNEADSPRVLNLSTTQKWHNQLQSCPVGYTGTSIPAATPAYDSAVSQADANAKANAAMVCIINDVSPSTWNSPVISGEVKAIAQQVDGKLLVGGVFATVDAVSRPGIARINLNGSLDTSFAAVTLDFVSVYSICVLASGKIMIGGQFLTVNGSTRHNIARLNTDGTLDTTFNAGAITPTSGSVLVMSIIEQADTKIVFSGQQFTAVAGTARNRIARVSSVGVLDSGFNPNTTGDIDGSLVDASGRYVFFGTFTQMSATVRNKVARTSSAGTLDSGFNPNVGGGTQVYGCAVQTDTKVVLAGDFTSIGGNSRSFLGRVNDDGTYDSSLAPTIGSTCLAVKVDSGGGVIFGGSFTTVAATTRNRIARVSSVGVLDSGFNPNANGPVQAIHITPTGYVVIGGTFTTVSSLSRSRVALLLANGTLV